VEVEVDHARTIAVAIEVDAVMAAAVDDRGRDKEDLNRDDDQVDEESHAVETLDKEEVDLDLDGIRAADPETVMVMGTVIVIVIAMDRDRDRIMAVDKVVHPAMEAVTDRDKQAAVRDMVRVVDPDTVTVMEPEADREIVMGVITATDHHTMGRCEQPCNSAIWMTTSKREQHTATPPSASPTDERMRS